MNFKTIALSAIVTVAGFNSLYAQPEVLWLSTTIDFGAFREDAGSVTAVFRGVNTGDKDLVVIDARANCGCTRPTYSTDPVAPGDTLIIHATYNPQGRPGRFSKNIYIDTNSTNKRSKLQIKGVVIGAPASIAARYPVMMGPVQMVRAAVPIGCVDKGHTKSVFENGYNHTDRTLHPEIKDVPEWLKIKTVPDSLPPGEQFNLAIFVDPDKTPLYGIVSDTITIIPDRDNPTDKFSLPVIADIREDFARLSVSQLANSPIARFDTTRFDMGKTTAMSMTARFTLHNDGKSPLIIRRLYSADPTICVSADKTSVNPGKTSVITVTAPLSANKPFSARIQAILNDPAAPIHNLRITAEP